MKIDERLLGDTSYYFRELGPVDSYTVALGPHRIVMINTKHDAGLPGQFIEAVHAYLGFGDEKAVNFIKSLINSEGFEDGDYDLGS